MIDKEFEVLMWLANSSDLNPIKHLWDELEKLVMALCHSTPSEFMPLQVMGRGAAYTISGSWIYNMLDRCIALDNMS